MSIQKRDLLIIVLYGSHGNFTDPVVEDLIEGLSNHLQIPVQAAFLDGRGLSVGESIQAGIAEHQSDQVIVLPFWVGASAARQDNIRSIVDAARERWPDIAIYYGESLSTSPGIMNVYRDLIDSAMQLSDQTVSPQDTALLLVGRGNRDRVDQHSEVYQIAGVLRTNSPVKQVEIAFSGVVQPDISSGIQHCLQKGARKIIILSAGLYDPDLYQTIEHQVHSLESRDPRVEIVIAPQLKLHQGVMDAVKHRYQEVLAELASSSWVNKPYHMPHTHGGSTHRHKSSPVFTDPLEAILPSRYQDGASVSAAPMGAAALIFDAKGQVAWDQIWDSFCDLALAGGPPHRGTLLEPVSPEVIAADPERYQWVVNELARGIRMVTRLAPILNQSPGWIGIQCADETMALWLLRAIIVENISIHREGTVLYLPAGPAFRLEYEIKNVITVVAKTYHYWIEHLTGKGPEKTER